MEMLSYKERELHYEQFEFLAQLQLSRYPIICIGIGAKIYITSINYFYHNQSTNISYKTITFSN